MADEVVTGMENVSDFEDTEQEGGLDTSLTGQQLKLLTALALNPNLQTAVEAAGVSRRTAFRWLRQPEFKEELTRQRGEMVAEAMATVTAQARRAATELLGLLSVKDDRLRRLICNDILAHAMKTQELDCLARRVEVLEKADKEREKRRTS